MYFDIFQNEVFEYTTGNYMINLKVLYEYQTQTYMTFEDVRAHLPVLFYTFEKNYLINNTFRKCHPF